MRQTKEGVSSDLQKGILERRVESATFISDKPGKMSNVLFKGNAVDIEEVYEWIRTVQRR